MEYIINEQKLHDVLYQMIYESLSISNEVSSVSSDIISAILKEIEKKGNDEPVSHSSFHTLIFKYPFNIEWTLFDLTKLNQEISIGAQTDFGNKTLEVIVIKDEYGYRTDLLSDSIQHEIEHIFQRLKRPDEKNFNEKDKALYDNALNLIKNNKPGTIQYNVGRAVYLMFNAEQDGYVNGLYARLKSIESSRRKYIEDTSDAWQQVNFLRRFNYQIVNNEQTLTSLESMQDALSSIGRDYKWLKLHTNKAIIRFLRKIAHIRKKLEDDDLNGGL